MGEILSELSFLAAPQVIRRTKTRKCAVISITGPHKNSVNAYSECTCAASVPPLPSGCLSSHPSISMTALTSFPPLHRELICRNVPAALGDHLVNTPIILSASASPYHPVVEMTPEGLTVQFTLNGWQLSRQRPCASLFLLTFIFPCQERDAAGARLIITAGPLGRDAATCLCDPVSSPYAHILSPPPRTYQTNYSSIAAPSSSLLPSAPMLHNIAEELLIYIFGHDASQLVVVSPSACH